MLVGAGGPLATTHAAESPPTNTPITQSVSDAESERLIGQSIRHRLITEAQPPRPESETPLNQAWPLISWFDQPVKGDWVAGECDATSDPLCDARWRRNEGLRGLKSRLDDWSLKTRQKIFGDKLGEHIEVDLDSSPEIRFSVDFQ